MRFLYVLGKTVGSLKVCVTKWKLLETISRKAPSGMVTQPIPLLEAHREQRLGGSREKQQEPPEVGLQGMPTWCRVLDHVISPRSCERLSAMFDQWGNQPIHCRAHLRLCDSKVIFNSLSHSVDEHLVFSPWFSTCQGTSRNGSVLSFFLEPWQLEFSCRNEEMQSCGFRVAMMAIKCFKKTKQKLNGLFFLCFVLN